MGLHERAERHTVGREGLRCEEDAAVAQELAARRAVLREGLRRHQLDQVGVTWRRGKPLARAERVQREYRWQVALEMCSYQRV